MMNSKIKEAWVNALRSGKYEQGSDRLRGVDGFCCLGVLCDIYAQEHNTEWEFRGNEETNLQPMDYWYYGGESEFLPKSVMDWAELKINNPQLFVDDEEEESFYVSHLNDNGYTFTTIADLIEAQL
jgi:hypothetical protein